MTRTFPRALLAVALFATVGCQDTRRPPAGSVAAVTQQAADARCAEHGAPAALCTKCNPALAAVFQAKGDWCTEHGFPESFCPACNPAAGVSSADAPADWCAEHGLPESSCTKCNPALAVRFQAEGDWCDEHQFPESACPACNPLTQPAGSQATVGGFGARIRFRSPEIERAAGISTVFARSATFGVTVACTARLDFDRNRMADIRAPISGVVSQVLVDLGERVAVGTELFVLESPRIGNLQGQLHASRQRTAVARANMAREEQLHASRISSLRELELARQDFEVAEAEQRSLEASLRIAGASASDQQGRYSLRAPKAGTVVRRPATVGTFATEDTSLATIADTSSVWAFLDIREMDAASVHVGHRVSLRVDGLPNRVFSGDITWIASEVSRRTRTVTARAELANPDGVLRANQFARATVHVAPPEEAVAVPREALQRLGEQQVVFVRAENGIYDPVSVLVGRSRGGLVEVSGAVAVNDAVVTAGAFLLKTELSKGDIGAGCCEVDGPGN